MRSTSTGRALRALPTTPAVIAPTTVRAAAGVLAAVVRHRAATGLLSLVALVDPS